MAKNESLYNQLLSHLTRVSSGALTAGSVDGYGAIGSVTKMPAETLIKPTADASAKAAGFGAKVTATGINFGKPSQSVQSVSNGSTNWVQLASNVASGGLTSLLGGAGSLGLGSIESGLVGLFGGGSKSLPALPLFTLPQSQDVTVYTGSSGSTVYQGSVDQTVTPKSQTPIYSNTSSGTAVAAPPSISASTSLKDTATRANAPASTASANSHPPASISTQSTSASVAPTDVNSQWFMERSSDIAAAVRNAMLNSSSLNDVVAEI
ncbi:MAG TPA: hypothetical protein VHZ07_21085 [Bryobacteraceae bacterium]|jgi:hypothetical protein|nr:hypothetical protein [Bryobacteraceae bacterium]